MVTECPKCQAVQTVECKQIEAGSEIECPECQSRLILKIVAELALVSETQDQWGPSISPSDQITYQEGADLKNNESDQETEAQVDFPTVTRNTQKTVLICIDGEATRDAVRALLEESGYRVVDAPSGIAAFMSMKLDPPAVALVDAGYTDMPGTELCEQIKGNPDLTETVVILIGSMFEKNTKYRDQPPVLSGADDYIDRRRIQKELLTKIEKLLETKEKKAAETCDEKPLEGASEIPFLSGIEEPAAQAEKPEYTLEQASEEIIETDLEPDDSARDDADALENAKRIARVIISDIAIYNEEKVEKGIQTASFHEVLAEEIMEGRRLFETRVPDYFDSSIYEDALENFVTARTASTTQIILPETEKPVDTLHEEAPLPPAPTQDFSDSPQDFSDSPVEVNTWEETVVPEVERPTEIFQSMETLAEAAIEDVAASEVVTSGEADSDTHKPESETETDPDADSDEMKNAKRLSNIIVSDIVIYNESKVKEGLQTDTFYEILGDEIEEGRKLFESRVSQSIFDLGVYEDALSAFIKKRMNATDAVIPEVEQAPEVAQAEEYFEEPAPSEPDMHETAFNPVLENGFEEEIEETKEEKDAKRLANIIVSDIVIYNESKVEEGLQTDTFYEILGDEIEEGRALYESRVSRDILETRNYYQEALETFINKRTASLL